MRTSIALTSTVFLLACGGSTPPVDNAARASQTSAPTSAPAPEGAAWAVCEHGPFSVSMPTGDDAELEPSASDACALVPRGMTGANPFALPWTVGLMFIPVGDSGPERDLAIEPDGARRWANQLIGQATETGEGRITILGVPTTWYGVHGRLPDGSVGDAFIARVVIDGTYVIALGASPESRPELRSRFLLTIAQIRRP